MKILHLIYDDINNPWLAGGGARAVHEINKRLTKKHSVTVVTGNYPNAVSGPVDGINYQRIGLPYNYFISRLSYVLYMPFLIRSSEFDIIIDDFSPFSPSFSVFYTSKPVIASIRIDFSLKDVLKRHKILGVLFYLCLRLVFRIFKYYFANAPVMKDLIIQRAGRNITVEYLPRGIDLSQYKQKKSTGNYILFLGRIDVYEKGLDLLLEAFSKLTSNKVKLVIAGGGAETEIIKLKKLILKYGLKGKIELAGRVEGQKKNELLQNCLFLCIPSRYGTWGAIPFEAYASGKTIVGTTILRDSVKNNITGLLADLDDSNQYYLAIKKLLDHPGLRKKLAVNGYKFAKKYDWDIVIKQYESYYKKVLLLHDKNSQK